MEIDREELQALSVMIGAVVRDYLAAPPYRREKVLTALNALGSASAWLIGSTEDVSVQVWFDAMVLEEIADVRKHLEEL